MKTIITAGASAALVITLATPVLAGPFDELSRKGSSEIYGVGQYFTGWEKTTALDGSVSLNLDSTFGGGFGVAYDIIDNLALNTELLFASLDMDADAGGTGVDSSSWLFGWNIGLDYNILKTRLTPVISASGGVLIFGGDWGSTSSSFAETDFTYGFGGGLRWDVTDHFHLKAIYKINWVNLQDSDDSTMFHTISIALGYRF